eukprot:10012758-Ditylum_brightwellii.AAC.1
MGEQLLGMGIGMRVNEGQLGKDIYNESITTIARDFYHMMQMGKQVVFLDPSMLLHRGQR